MGGKHWEQFFPRTARARCSPTSRRMGLGLPRVTRTMRNSEIVIQLRWSCCRSAQQPVSADFSAVNHGALNMMIFIRPQHLLVLLVLCTPVHGQENHRSDVEAKDGAATRDLDDPQSNVLNPGEWRRVDAAVDRGLAWLATQQQPDGSFPTISVGQPGVTSLCVLAFMAHGHNPGEGRDGDRLERATKFILSCQKENGLVALHGPEGPTINRNMSWELGVTTAYDHAISSLALSEVYGMGKTKRSEPMQRAIEQSLAATLEMQNWPKDHETDKGGWRYIKDFDQQDSDLSLSGWNLMFLRSARNAGFNVPKKSIDDAVAYIRRTFDKDMGVFGYTTMHGDSYSRAMAGAEFLRSRMPDFTIRSKQKLPPSGCTSTALPNTTRTAASLMPIDITTACSMPAMRCTNWAAPIGPNFFRRQFGRY